MSLLPRPPRRRLVFMLTPLVDVMFLLLIFFMLTSQTSPYRMILLSATAQGAPQEATAATETGPDLEAVVSISHLFVRINDEQVAMADLPAAIARLRTAGISTAVALPTQSATVQDIVAVLEAFQSTEFGTLRLISTAVAP